MSNRDATLPALLWQNRAGTPWMQFRRSTEPLLSKSLCFQLHPLWQSVCFQLHPLPETMQSQPRLFTVTPCILPPCCIPTRLTLNLYSLFSLFHWCLYFIDFMWNLYGLSSMCIMTTVMTLNFGNSEPCGVMICKNGFFQKPPLCVAKKQMKQTKQTNTKHGYKHLAFSYMFCFCWLFHFCWLLVLFVFRFFSSGCPVHSVCSLFFFLLVLDKLWG